MDEKPAISVEILDDGPCRKRLKAEIPAESVRLELDSNYRQLGKTLQLPGFRKGRVPRTLLERRFGTQVHEEVRDELVNTTFKEEIERREFRVFGEPTYDKVEFEVGSPLRYEAIFEVFPTVEVGNYLGLEIEALPTTVTDEDVARELEALRQESATLEDVPAGQQQDGDVAICKLVMKDGDEVLIERDDVHIKVGTDRLDSIPIEGMSERLRALPPDEETTFEVTLPEDFPREPLRNRKVNLALRLQAMKRARLPDLDDVLAQQFEVESIEILRNRLKESLVARRRTQEEHRQEDALLDRLVEGLGGMELPPSVVARRVEEQQLHERWRLQRAGKDAQEIEQLLAQDSSGEEQARRELKKLFVLDHIAEHERIFVLEDEIWRRLAQIARARGEDAAQIATEYSESGALANLRDAMQREKVRKFLREKAVVVGGADGGEGPGPSGASDEPRVADTM